MAFDTATNQRLLDQIFGAGVIQAGGGRGDAALRAAAFSSPEKVAQYDQLRKAADPAYTATDRKSNGAGQAAPVWSTDMNTAILRSLGAGANFQAGDGRGEAWLAQQNPDTLKAYQSARNLYGGQESYKTNPAFGQESLTDVMSRNVQNPQLPAGGQAVPITQQVQGNEIQGSIQMPGATPVGTPANVTAAPITAAQQSGVGTQVDGQAIAGMVDPSKGQYDATKTTAVAPMQAQQGQVSELATVQGQLKKLYGDMANGETPPWAQGAMAKANDAMAARGIGKSSIAAGAIASAIQQSAINIAAPDAATYFQMDMKNLDNRQQAELTNVQMRQQNMLTDTAAENVAKQFNASSATQVEQFQANLIASISTQNAATTASMQQFNAAQTNQVNAQNSANELDAAKFNVQQKVAVDSFNAQIRNNRDQFNATMQFAIDQSNVMWRRSVNTANNAAANAASQLNTQNAYNLSQVAMNNLWQEYRDSASWAFEAGQNAQNLAYNVAMAATNRGFITKQNDNASNLQMAATLGKFALDLFA